MPTYPVTDGFGQGDWRQGQPIEYARGRANGSTFTDSDGHLIWSSGDTAARVGGGTGYQVAFLYRRVPDAGDVLVRNACQFVSVSGSSNTFAGCIARATAQNYTATATSNVPDRFGPLGDGYYLRLRHDGNVELTRYNAGTETVLATGTVTVTGSTWHDLDLKCETNSSGNVELTATFDATDVTGMDPYTDSSGSKITAAGHSGFVICEYPSGRRFMSQQFRLQSADGATTHLDDDFNRPSQALITYGGDVHPSLMWEFGNLSQGSSGTLPKYDSDRLSVTNTSDSAQFVDLYQRTPASADQYTEAILEFAGAQQNPVHLAGVVARGSKSAIGSGTASFTGYVGLLSPGSPWGKNGVRLLRYNAGTLTTLASIRRQVSADVRHKLALQVTTDGGNADCTVSVGGYPLIQYTDTSPITATGLQGLVWTFDCLGASCANSGSVLFHNFRATAETFSVPTFGGEPAIAGTLSYTPEAPEDALERHEVTRYETERGYVQSWQKFRRPRATWTGVQWVRDTTDAEAIIAFLRARELDGKAFYLDGEHYTGKAWMLAKPGTQYRKTAPNTWRIGPVTLIERLDVTATP